MATMLGYLTGSYVIVARCALCLDGRVPLPWLLFVSMIPIEQQCVSLRHCGQIGALSVHLPQVHNATQAMWQLGQYTTQ